jgi:hypothetical protein
LDSPDISLGRDLFYEMQDGLSYPFFQGHPLLPLTW